MMGSRLLFGLCICGLMATGWPVANAAITLGQVDDFQDGTTANWSYGGGRTPDNIADGGPLGDGDHYLQLASTGGFDQNSRLIVFNTTQWLGNYNAAGVTAIAMDLWNPNGFDLSIRLVFKQGAAQSAPGYSSTVAFDLPADGQWHHAVFDLNAADFTAIGSPTLSFADLLSNPGQVRILHSSFPSLIGDVVPAQLGIDNITAVPEPSTVMLVMAGSLGLVALSVRRCRRGVDREKRVSSDRGATVA